MQKSFRKIMKRFSEIQSIYCELDNKISDFLSFLFNTDITVKADLSDKQINEIINGVLGGRKCEEEKDVHSVDSVDVDIKEGGQNE